MVIWKKFATRLPSSLLKVTCVVKFTAGATGTAALRIHRGARTIATGGRSVKRGAAKVALNAGSTRLKGSYTLTIAIPGSGTVNIPFTI